MSAGFSPSNPNQPRRNPKAPNPSILARHGGKIVAGGALVGTALFYLLAPPKPRDEPVIGYGTTGVKNIEKAYTNAGATPTHTKAYGGTRQGENESVYLREGGGTGAPNHKDSPFKKEGMGDEQRPGSPTKVEEAFASTNYGSGKGK